METIVNKLQREIIVALVLVLIGAGVTASYEAPYNPYDGRVSQVDAMMQDALNNPTELNLGAAQDELFYTYYPWAERQTSEGKDTFIDYLEACNQVIIQTSKGIDADTSKMNELRDTLLS